MQKTIDGKTYERVREITMGCKGCVGASNINLCKILNFVGCSSSIWKEVTPPATPARFKSCEMCGAEIAELRERVAEFMEKLEKRIEGK